MPELSATIRAYLAREGVTQGELARRAGVSQSAVSRALGGMAQRNGRARRRLSIYMQQAHLRPEVVNSALLETWDGTEAHAHALATLIRASRELWPDLGEEGARDGAE